MMDPAYYYYLLHDDHGWSIDLSQDHMVLETTMVVVMEQQEMLSSEEGLLLLVLLQIHLKDGFVSGMTNHHHHQ